MPIEIQGRRSLYQVHQEWLRKLKLAVELADSIYVVGFPTIDGIKQDYSTIVKHFDLKEMGLAWQKFDTRHLELMGEVDKVMMES